MAKWLLAIALFATVSTGCKDSRLSEERAADQLEVSLDNKLELEARRLATIERTRHLQKGFDMKVANLRRHYEGN